MTDLGVVIADAHLGKYAASQVLAYCLCWATARQWLPKADPAFAADALYGLVYYPALVLLACDAVGRLGDSVADRWTGVATSSLILGKLLLSRMLIHVPYLWLKRRPEDRKMLKLYLVHHAVVIIVYGAGVLRRKAHYWGALNALCELTNIFCTVIELFSCCSPQAREKWRRLYVLNSAGFGLSYCAMRLALFPLCLYWYWCDAWADPAQTWHRVGVVEQWVFPTGIIMTFGLSVRWAVPVARGTLKTVFGVNLDGTKLEKKLVETAEMAAATAVAAAQVAAAGAVGEEPPPLTNIRLSHEKAQ